MADPKHPNFEAGRRATKHVYGVEPDMTREGGSIPVTLVLQVTFLMELQNFGFHYGYYFSFNLEIYNDFSGY